MASCGSNSWELRFTTSISIFFLPFILTFILPFCGSYSEAEVLADAAGAPLVTGGWGIACKFHVPIYPELVCMGSQLYFMVDGQKAHCQGGGIVAQLEFCAPPSMWGFRGQNGSFSSKLAVFYLTDRVITWAKFLQIYHNKNQVRNKRELKRGINSEKNLKALKLSKM